MKDFYLTILMLDKGNNVDIKEHFLDRYLADCNNLSFKNKVITSLSFVYKVSHDTLLLNTELQELNNGFSTWSDLIRKNIGRVVYIDLWASWCQGCIVNIPKVRSMKEKHPNLEVIFISKDRQAETWRKAVSKWDINSLGQQLRLDPDTELAKIITFPTIPRGILINKQGGIVTIDADEPNSPELNILIESLL